MKSRWIWSCALAAPAWKSWKAQSTCERPADKCLTPETHGMATGPTACHCKCVHCNTGRRKWVKACWREDPWVPSDLASITDEVLHRRERSKRANFCREQVQQGGVNGDNSSRGCHPTAHRRVLAPMKRTRACQATNLTAGRFRVLPQRGPFLRIRRNQLPPQVGRESVRSLLSSVAVGHPNN